MATKNRASPAKATSVRRQGLALELRRAGLSYSEIAVRIGVGKSQAFRLVTAAMTRAHEEIAAQADEHRIEELSRLDGLLQTFYPRAARGDLRACDCVLKIIERRCRLLGLDRSPARTPPFDAPPPAPGVGTVTIYAARLSTQVLHELLDARVRRD